MRRRVLVSLLGSTTAIWPLASLAQQPIKSWRIGFLTPRSRPVSPDRDPFSDAFIQGMSERGYTEGKNLAVEWRYADGDHKRLTDFAIELVHLNPSVIVTYGTAAARILQGSTKTIAIVVAAAVDLVGAGIVASLAHPGGNITGLSVINVDMSSKQLELLKAMLPSLSRVAVLLNPGNSANPAVLKHLQSVAPTLGVEVVALNAATPQAIDSGVASMAQAGVSGMIVAADAFFSGQGPLLAALALRHRMATISLYQDHVRAGCLMSYGADVAAFHRQAATYVDKILKGAKPASLPVEQPTNFPLAINLKTAKALGLAIPPTILARADEVIE